jgi:hypothetical protein
MSDKGIPQQVVEAGASLIKATGDEIANSVSTAASQITGSPQKSEHELQQIAAADRATSASRIHEIQQQLAQQKIRRFQEVSSWNGTPTSPQSQDTAVSEIPGRPSSLTPLRGSRQNMTPLSVKQATGKTEQGRDLKG